MAQKPKTSSGAKVSNMIEYLRGNFDFGSRKDDSPEGKPIAYGSPEMIAPDLKTKILSGAFRAIDRGRERTRESAGSLLGIVGSSLSKVGNERLENRKILQLVPEVDKAARLMIASSFSPNDLARGEIPVTFDCHDISESYKTRLSEKATKFFQEKLNLMTSAPSWVYQFGYETGSAPFAIIPLRSFERIEDNSFIGQESLIKKVVEPICHESLFGFGDAASAVNDLKTETMGLESLANQIILDIATESKISFDDNKVPPGLAKDLISKFIATEALNLTDNPDVLQVKDIANKKRDKRTKDVLSKRYRPPKTDTVVSVSADRDPGKNGGVGGNPILMRLPPESVTIIHTPGNPNDHQGYLILLDHAGNPINSVAQEEAASARPVNYNANQGNIFAQVYNAYGLTSGFRGASDADTMSRLYTSVVSEHLRKRLGTAGYSNTEIPNIDSVLQCMFSRFLQAKQTRILFMPKDLVTYMAFELDQNGYGVSRLDRIKFNLGMKMAVQVSRVLASIKAAMDRRRIEIRFTDNLMEQPEAVFDNVIREYINKSTMSFSIDPNVIQNQIADKSVSVKGTDIPGVEQFDLTNEPDQRTSSVDFDPSILEYLDKQILNGLRVPASTMNSLSEDEYARSVATTNLFFSMDISIDQDIIIKHISDLLRKYARYSEEFQKELIEIAPSLGGTDSNIGTDQETPKKGKSKAKSDDKGKTKEKEEEGQFPNTYTIDSLIDRMVISLPKPNVAPSKAQFEALEAMITAITNTMTALFPDELTGSDDSLRATVGLLRARFTSANIRTYLESSGMSSLIVPDSNFSGEMKDLRELMTALKNVAIMMEDQTKITAQPDVAQSETSEIPGY